MPEHPATEAFLARHRAAHRIRNIAWKIGGLGAVLLLTYTGINLARGASNERDWAPDHSVTPHVEFSSVGTSTLYHIDGIRTTDYSKQNPTSTYFADSILATDIVGTWYVVVPFAGIGAAHTFLSFEMEDGSFLSVSVEARREVGEKYSPWLGLIDQYELIYVLADERDVIGRRVAVDGDPVYLYPTVATPEQSRALFDNAMRRVAKLADKPESYDTIINNCTTNLARHVNEALGNGTVPWSSTLVMPKNSDKYALSLGLLDVAEEDGIDAIRKRHLVNEVASAVLDRPSFSRLMREKLGLTER